tara:strand:+ start:2353 stop:2979 length:627 start_codon:yes stop_codon:yes gene_type:complete
MENSKIMKEAYASLKGKWGLAIGGNLLFAIISMAVALVGWLTVGEDWGANLTSLIFAPPLAIGMTIFSLNISRDNNPEIDNLFIPFKTSWVNAILAYFMMGVLVAVGFILLIIPGIIVALMFSQVFFIMGEDNEISAYDALVKSMNMMKGYKWKFFRIALRIIGLAILCIFTLGIGFIWLLPYQNVVYAKFYDDIKNNPSFKNQEYIN